jgi:hypothetical protein
MFYDVDPLKSKLLHPLEKRRLSQVLGIYATLAYPQVC